MEVVCNNCGGTDWNEIVETDYPERRKERERTVETVYDCDECGAQGKRFRHRNEGTVTLSGAMR